MRLALIIDWALLQALVSHTPLTARINIVTFLCELISHPPLLEPYQRELLKEPVLKLFHQAMYPMETGRYAAYNPAHVAVTRRHASYTCNLVVLLTILGDGILGSELFPGGSDCTYRWRNLALLWRSQLPADGWQMLLEYLNLDRIRTDNIRDIRLSVTGQRQQKPSLDMFWSYQHALPSAQPDEDFTWTFHRPEDIRGNVYYLCDWRIDAAAHV